MAAGIFFLVVGPGGPIGPTGAGKDALIDARIDLGDKALTFASPILAWAPGVRALRVAAPEPACKIE
ncbi:MAG TPA: hypothetical protein VG105_08815 [Paraburkholderia sp.]|nr:hypothetical protein [Paraburkholderia sp.]